jgi:muramoyltetrapeptide carboxypeptidase
MEKAMLNKAMKSPQLLKKGDKVGIVSTARKISAEEVQPAIEKLQSWGLEVELGPNLFQSYHQFAGTDAQRASDFQFMIDREDIKAIICARGGYGTVRIIDQLDFSRFQKNPKWIVGYSDVTVLHSEIHIMGIETIHGTMPINFPKDGVDNAAVGTLRSALFGEKLEYRFPAICNQSFENIEGVITGGNLSMLYSMLGSPSSINTDNKILFFEDLDEYLYHIDRMMMNLKRNGLFDNPTAVLIGGLSDMNDNTIPFGFSAEEIVRHHIETHKYPVIFGFPAGHIDDNRAIILGRKAQLSRQDEYIIFKQ